ncbi:LLM class flavin-dependent oxidoreductase [Nakamurella leprariae]|uniref:LLM class flavin-dependent oxidoreductase n=1 Tax=Nakamurella leprariae TaxID=2803911 RepID=A0A938YEK5_9ACTN|nr:LLM class flavin-dependent oxidoreductase [Nakamurella leprariae]MBM9469277.1 LLM class flavin-dependent oxidoreductase [Nakamurella leprariae]
MHSPALFLALELDGPGAHPAAWTAASGPPDQPVRPGALRAAVRAAETAGYDLITLDDSALPPTGSPEVPARLEAGTRAAFVATTTERIGLAPTLAVTVTEPFHLATQLASLDHASRGRAAWVVAAPADAATLATIGADPLTPAEVQRELADVIAVARDLWDSWEDDAVIKDAATGRYLDPDKVHHVDFRGGRFGVKGPLITPRPPQGQVLVLGADDLGVTDQLDVALIAAADATGVGRRADAARRAGAPLVFAEVEVVLDTEAGPATARLAALDATTPWPGGRRLRHVGSAAALVDLLRTLAEHVDGVRLFPAVHDLDGAELAARVLPGLAAAGLHRPDRAGATLRERLGLPRSPSRFAADHRTDRDLAGAHR